MERIANNEKQQSYEAWLRRRTQAVDDLGVVTMAAFTGGLLEPGSPDYAEISRQQREATPETKQQLAGVTLAMLDVKQPQNISRDIYRHDALLGHAE